jgi:hypothetical protein
VTYVFDSGPLIVLFRHYYQDRFPSLWHEFDSLIEQGEIISVREAARELDGQTDNLSEWVRRNGQFFPPPTVDELEFVREIFQIAHFQGLIRKQERLQGRPVADPFVIARAKVLDSCVVTNESFKPNASMIPNVCDHFGIPYLNLEGFMARENWKF